MNSEKLKHYERLDSFIQERIEKDIYPEIPMEPHPSITRDMINKLEELKPLEGMRILDVGCGQGLALEIFKNKQSKPIGITFGEDYKVCKSKGFEVYEMDQSFLDFEAKSFDVIWCRHAIEHSLFPLFTLDGFMHVLKDDGLLYIEVPAPNTSAHHENNPNHYSCFTPEVWLSLFAKAGFMGLESLEINFQAQCGPDTYNCFFLKKNIKS